MTFPLDPLLLVLFIHAPGTIAILGPLPYSIVGGLAPRFAARKSPVCGWKVCVLHLHSTRGVLVAILLNYSALPASLLRQGLSIKLRQTFSPIFDLSPSSAFLFHTDHLFNPLLQ